MKLTDFQILQRDADGFAHITWEGELHATISDPNTHVVVRVVQEDDNLTIQSWSECTLDGVAAGCRWSIALAIPEGGLYRLEAALQPGDSLWIDKIACVYHIGVGDIYVTAGQSNMTGYGRDAAYDPPCLGVHMYRNNGSWSIAAHPLADALGGLYAYPENGTGTSPALSFARRLHDRLGIPIGIVPSAVGATPLSEWSPAETGGCYREMEKRLQVVGDFKGFIWLQGCEDCIAECAGDYLERFSRMISLWNDAFGKHPVLTVQLNRWTSDADPMTDRYWGMIREAQRRAALEIPGVYVVSSLDLPVTDSIHNSSGANVTIGERLANVALASLYGKPGQNSVFILSAEVTDSTHVLLHLTPGHRVLAMGCRAIGMNVEDAEGLIDCIEATPVPDGLIVSTARPYQLPAQFHYAWRAHPPVFAVRDFYDLPLLSCYGLEIAAKS